ncbi:MAG: thioredoxin family protein [Acidobacteriota bacterium]
MAVESRHVTSVIVEASEYPDLVRQYRVSGVPKTVVNDTVEILGVQPEDSFIRAALEPPPSSSLL